MKVPELCKTCKYAVLLSYGLRCRKRMRVRYQMGKPVCIKHRLSKRFENQTRSLATFHP